MEEKELDILEIVAENPSISQRKIAEKTGISLGQVNFLLKKFVKKGLIKIEGQSSKSIQYNLTPKGIKEKAEKTLNYIKISYSAVLKMSQRIRDVIKEETNQGHDLYLLGDTDEIYDLAVTILKESNARFIYVQATEQIVNKENICILYWDMSKVEELVGFNSLNIIYDK